MVFLWHVLKIKTPPDGGVFTCIGGVSVSRIMLNLHGRLVIIYLGRAVTSWLKRHIPVLRTGIRPCTHVRILPLHPLTCMQVRGYAIFSACGALCCCQQRRFCSHREACHVPNWCMTSPDGNYPQCAPHNTCGCVRTFLLTKIRRLPDTPVI